MKKNLLTFLFVVAFLCGGALVVSAKNSSPSANSVAVSKRLSVAKTISNKTKALKARCEVGRGCGAELAMLFLWNTLYESVCAPDYITGCSPLLENALTGVGTRYEECLNNPARSSVRNIDRNMDRNKIQKPRDVTSE